MRNLRTLLLLNLVLMGTATTCSTLQGGKFDWPQWRGPDRTDVSKETGLLAAWPEPGPRLLWTFKDAGLGFASFAVVGDHLYSMGASKGTEVLYAVDLKTRQRLWSAEVGNQFGHDRGDGPRGTPTVDGNRVYGIGGQGNLACVDVMTGKKVWSKGLKTDLGGSQMSGWGYSESPLVDGDLVLAMPGGDQGTVAAFDKKTGELKWRSTELKDKAGYSSLVVAVLGGIRQYVLMTGDSVAGVAAADGKLLWRFARASRTAAVPTPIVKDNYIYVTSGYGVGCALLQITPKGAGFNVEEVYANKGMTNHHGGVVLLGDHLYGYSDTGGWTCQEFKTGKVVWASKKLGKGCVTSADGHLYCYDERDGTCVLAEASPNGWKETGRFKIQQTKLDRKRGQIWSHPVVANGKLYLRDQDLIFCYDVSKAQ